MEGSQSVKMAKAAEVLGTTKKQIQTWFERGQLVLPEVKAGKGETAIFSDFDLLFCGIVLKLTEFGAQVRTAVQIAQYVFEKLGAEPTDSDLLAPWKGKQLYIDNMQPGRWGISIWEDDGEPMVKSTVLVLRPELLFSEILERAKAARQPRRVA
jgi:hypothetical protein